MLARIACIENLFSWYCCFVASEKKITNQKRNPAMIPRIARIAVAGIIAVRTGRTCCHKVHT